MPGKLYNASAQGSFSDGNSTRFWRFGDCEFDELGRQLWVKGEIANLESKALDVLLYLLLHAGEVVTNEELLESVWPDVIFVDGSLTVAISNLREAIRDAERSVIVTVPRIGYQIATPVHCKMFTGHLNLSLGLTAGSPVPRCEQWQLTRPLDPNASNEVWLAEHLTSAEQRVFKFASDGNRLRCLKREIAISRYLREALGDRPEFVRLLKWNLETKPCFVECEYAGLNLLEWSASGALTSMSVNERLKLVLGITRAVADAHSLGVLHKDLRPANILVVPGVDGGWQTSITDFGCPSLFEPSRLL